MHAYNSLVHDCCDRKNVENIHKNLEYLKIAFSFTFIVESIQSVNVGALMVSSQHEKCCRILNFEAEKQHDALERIFSTIDVIS